MLSSSPPPNAGISSESETDGTLAVILAAMLDGGGWMGVRLDIELRMLTVVEHESVTEAASEQGDENTPVSEGAREL